MPADRAGYERLLEWAISPDKVVAFGIEETGSYGVGFTSLVRRRGHKVIEVVRQDRRERRLNGKSDLLDAGNAVRAVLAGAAKAIPKSADGVVEMLRQIKVAKDTAVKARTSAMITLKALLVNVDPELRTGSTPEIVHQNTGSSRPSRSRRFERAGPLSPRHISFPLSEGLLGPHRSSSLTPRFFERSHGAPAAASKPGWPARSGSPRSPSRSRGCCSCSELLWRHSCRRVRRRRPSMSVGVHRQSGFGAVHPLRPLS
jgi:hypothetical protein